MSDIMNHIRYREASRLDPDGNLLALEDWDEGRARAQAAAEGIELSSEHWEVVEYLRLRYRDLGPAANAREVTRALARQFAARGGRRYLFRLFPRGPVAQASRIAGLPRPPHTSDPSFGNVH